MKPTTTRYALALAALLAGLAHGGEFVEYKGSGGVCNAGCTNLGIHQSVTIAAQPAAQPQPPAVASAPPETGSVIRVNAANPPPLDLEAEFYYSVPGVKRDHHRLDNGSVLYDGDPFIVRLRARKELYVYLFLIDSQGKPQELVSATGFADNHLRAGETWELPRAKPDGTTRHFYLDNHPGVETLHLIASPTPLPDLMADYRAGALTDAVVQQAETKGILWTDEPPAATPQPVRQGPRRMSCPAHYAYCRETFTFDHRPAAQRSGG